MALLSRIKQPFTAAYHWVAQRAYVALPTLALLVTLILEILSRRGIGEALTFIVNSPLFFGFNVLIILFTLLPAMFTRRRRFTLCLISEIWLGLGIANYVVLSYRTTPLGMIDLLLAGNVLRMINKYLSPWQIILILIGIAAVICMGILLWRHSPKERIRPIRSLVSLAVVTIVIALAGNYSAEAVGDSFGNLAVAYDDLGFAYCFSTSVIDRGIEEPEDYSEELVEEISEDFDIEADDEDLTANVIFIQLESFFDPATYAGIDLGYDPIPVFTSLREKHSNGYLSMPSIGAGTANSEFEVLTGMNMDHFGAGEYPYKTILLDNTCESMAHVYAEAGYAATAIHNHIRSFYGRETVYENLGFDRFVSLENMENVSFTPTGWAKDDVLTGEILKVLDASTKRDFIYTVSVQAHGKYTDIFDEEEQAESPETEEEVTEQAWEYYAEQLSGTDAFVGELLETLEQRSERCVVVLFGDHLPSLQIDETLLDCGDQFKTEYIIWSNFDLEKLDRELQAYQLGAYVQERLGLCLGNITALHQEYGWDSSSEAYQEALQTIEYDMLYGEKYIFDMKDRYFPSNLELN